MWFAYVHAAWFAAWIGFNLLGEAAFDPFPFVLLTTLVSLEAIFLTLMVLVSQNREAQVEEQRTDLDLQIDLLAEYELTRMMCLMVTVARKLGIEDVGDLDLSDLEKTIRPRDLLHELERFDSKQNDQAG